LAFNSNNDLFAAVRGAEYNFYPGVYILRNGSNSWESHIEGTMVEDLIINSTDHIYISSSWPEGIGRSIDNGANFEMINRGLGGGGMGKMIFDQEEFIYTTTSFSTSSIYKSTKTSVNIFEDPERYNNNNVVIYPNPFINDLNIRLLYTPYHFSRLQIFNNFGLEVYHKDLNLISSQIDINTENLLPGLYLLHLKSENAIRVFKLIKY